MDCCYLKNTSDDAIPNYLNSLKFKQSHTLTDVRLGLGYAAFFVSAACFGWDYQFGFESTKYYTAAAVAVYLLLNTALTLWIWFKEKGIVYVGTAPSGETITIATHTRKNVPIYNLTITIAPKSGKPRTIDLSRSFTEWFDAAGHFVVTPFQMMLASTVPAIGNADPKRANVQEAVGPQYTDEELTAMLAAAGATPEDANASTTGSSTKKGGKRRKAGQ
ncbi:Signal peptidase complex subunit SPC2 [Cytospora mali]|uniref:Signal peptidase complex subunit 2 n=1 Tax=Cytospora mali TaxID=578113 RepID=A0A194V1R9_CYTMA|nr:Signal peptidase complex subunit SPC2 [Valsa mali var. pyri (nom. inval.)]